MILMNLITHKQRGESEMNYTMAIRSAGLAALSSTVCNRCYVDGNRVAFFGVPMTGGTLMGNRSQDLEFQKAVWNAAKKHVREVHGLKVVRNGMGGWKTVKLEA
jgi:hypothetical protein